jgi:hypothetical protein
MTADTRTAAAWGLAGLGWVLNGLLGLDAVDGTGGFYATEAAWLPVHALVLFGLVGLLHAGVVGRSRWGRAGLQLAIGGRLVFLVAEVAAMIAGEDELPLFPVAAVSTGIGMLMAGVAAIRARRWEGWRRYTPIAMGAYPFLVMFPILAITGERPNLAVTLWGLTFVAIAAAALPAPSARRSAIPAA